MMVNEESSEFTFNGDIKYNNYNLDNIIASGLLTENIMEIDKFKLMYLDNFLSGNAKIDFDSLVVNTRIFSDRFNYLEAIQLSGNINVSSAYPFRSFIGNFDFNDS